MEINKSIIFCLIILFAIPLVSGINCIYNMEPLMKDRITWICYNTSSKYCLSYVEFNEQLLQVNPVLKRDFAILPFLKKTYPVGIADKFEVQNSIVNIYFRKDLLRDGRTVLFGIECNNESFAVNVTPKFSEYPQVIDRGTWIQENLGYIIGWIVIIIIALFFLRWAWKQRK